MLKPSSVAILMLLTTFSVTASDQPLTVTTTENVEWGYLNPARGDQSPGAANLWGDRTKDTATGMLVRFNKGFSSPPHIHNITYKGIVIEGELHNDDPNAAPLWMPATSFWTQPAGEDHITAARGSTNLIYLEIESGPYLVKSSDNAFDNGERPLNLHRDNMVWQSHNTGKSTEYASVALWGEREEGNLNGRLLSLAAGFEANLEVYAEEFRIVVISGELRANDHQQLKPASYMSIKKGHSVSLSSQSGAVIYIRTQGKFDIQ